MTFSILRRSAAWILLAGTSASIYAELEIHPQHFGAAVDYGQVVASSGQLPDNQPITRSAAYMAMSATWDKRFDINLGMGGLFWYALPEKNFRDRLLLSGFGVGRAEGVYAFGDPKDPTAKLHMGLFDHKYNPDAKNLGEYLFRSGAYPVYLWTGGWSYINAASYQAQGFRLNLPTMGGMVTHDFSLYMERNISPTHDFSPAYLVTVKPSSAFEFGAGFVWQNGLSMRGDSVLAPRQRLNAYYKNGPYADVPLTQSDRDKPGYEAGDTAIVPDGDSRIGQSIASRYHMGRPAIYVDSAGNGTSNSQLGFYSFKAVKAMARASVDIGSFFAGMKPKDFKFYFEWAWLGIQNQPFYYNKPSERMPVLFGLNIPTFGLLEVLNVELDYRKSVFENALALAWDQRLPIPITSQTDNPLTYREEGRRPYLDEQVAQGQTLAYADSAFTAELGQREMAASENAWHWSIYAKRKLSSSVSITAQIASDHLRHFDIVFATPSSTPATKRTKDWYYVVRLEFGI
jgi:hypothetical protein